MALPNLAGLCLTPTGMGKNDLGASGSGDSPAEKKQRVVDANDPTLSEADELVLWPVDDKTGKLKYKGDIRYAPGHNKEDAWKLPKGICKNKGGFKVTGAKPPIFKTLKAAKQARVEILREEKRKEDEKTPEQKAQEAADEREEKYRRANMEGPFVTKLVSTINYCLSGWEAHKMNDQTRADMIVRRRSIPENDKWFQVQVKTTTKSKNGTKWDVDAKYGYPGMIMLVYTPEGPNPKDGSGPKLQRSWFFDGDTKGSFSISTTQADNTHNTIKGALNPSTGLPGTGLALDICDEPNADSLEKTASALIKLLAADNCDMFEITTKNDAEEDFRSPDDRKEWHALKWLKTLQRRGGALQAEELSQQAWDLVSTDRNGQKTKYQVKLKHADSPRTRWDSKQGGQGITYTVKRHSVQYKTTDFDVLILLWYDDRDGLRGWHKWEIPVEDEFLEDAEDFGLIAVNVHVYFPERFLEKNENKGRYGAIPKKKPNPQERTALQRVRDINKYPFRQYHSFTPGTLTEEGVFTATKT